MLYVMPLPSNKPIIVPNRRMAENEWLKGITASVAVIVRILMEMLTVYFVVGVVNEGP
jgi:hypothetical protein